MFRWFKRFINYLLIKCKFKKQPIIDDEVYHNVRTYQQADLAFMQNSRLFLATAHKNYRDFDKIENLGLEKLSFDKPPRLENNQERFEGVYLMPEKK